mgnify:CR=1 FL=1
MRVLIAEDNQSIVNGYKRIFPAFNIEIIDIAVDGLEAVEKYHKHANRIDLVLCDNSMPRMSGLEASRRILSLDRNAVIVIVSSDSLDEDSCLKSGVRAVIKKPFSFEELVHQLFFALTNAVETKTDHRPW